MRDEENDRIIPTHSWDHGPARVMVVPAKTLYVSVVGDSTYDFGAPENLRSDPDGRYYDPPSFIAPKSIPFGPLIERRFIRIPSFSDNDWTRLEQLSETGLPDDCRGLIDDACELFVNSVALEKQMATWKDLRFHLEVIAPTARTLVNALKDARPMAPERGVLPPIQTIGTYLAMMLPDPPYGLDRLLPDLARLAAFAEDALVAAKTGPGTGAQAALRLFLNTLDDVAITLAIPRKLLGHDEYQKVDPTEVPPDERARPAFFKFVREILLLAHRYGAPAISNTDLPQNSKDAALETLSAYTKKSDKALSKQLERIREDFRKS